MCAAAGCGYLLPRLPTHLVCLVELNPHVQLADELDAQYADDQIAAASAGNQAVVSALQCVACHTHRKGKLGVQMLSTCLSGNSHSDELLVAPSASNAAAPERQAGAGSGFDARAQQRWSAAIPPLTAGHCVPGKAQRRAPSHSLHALRTRRCAVLCCGA